MPPEDKTETTNEGDKRDSQPSAEQLFQQLGLKMDDIKNARSLQSVQFKSMTDVPQSGSAPSGSKLSIFNIAEVAKDGKSDPREGQTAESVTPGIDGSRAPYATDLTSNQIDQMAEFLAKNPAREQPLAIIAERQIDGSLPKVEIAHDRGEKTSPHQVLQHDLEKLVPAGEHLKVNFTRSSNGEFKWQVSGGTANGNAEFTNRIGNQGESFWKHLTEEMNQKGSHTFEFPGKKDVPTAVHEEKPPAKPESNPGKKDEPVDVKTTNSLEHQDYKTGEILKAGVFQNTFIDSSGVSPFGGRIKGGVSESNVHSTGYYSVAIGFDGMVGNLVADKALLNVDLSNQLQVSGKPAFDGREHRGVFPIKPEPGSNNHWHWVDATITYNENLRAAKLEIHGLSPKLEQPTNENDWDQIDPNHNNYRLRYQDSAQHINPQVFFDAFDPNGGHGMPDPSWHCYKGLIFERR